MKHFALEDGKFYELRDGDYHPLPFGDVMEIFNASSQEMDMGLKALEKMNGDTNTYTQH